MAKFKLPTLKQIKAYLKTNAIVLITGIVLGVIGANLYLKQVPREAMLEATSRAATLGTLTPTPESQVFVAFILTGLMAALLVTHFMPGKRRR